jgi:hypothetical protein
MSNNQSSSNDQKSDWEFPADFEKKARQRYEKIAKPETSFEKYLEHEKSEFQRLKAMEADPSQKYQPTIGTKTPCGNGDFEESLDPNEWQGAYGTFPSPGNPNDPPGVTINFGSLTTGILVGPLNAGMDGVLASQAHQTWVPAGVDPVVGIPTTAPGSSGAVRIGNVRSLRGVDLLSKTFVVTAAKSIINFWYAVVFQNPQEPRSAQPFFWVRVTDALGNIIPGAFDFGSGSDMLVADPTNPFFQSQMGTTYPNVTIPGEKLLFKNWTAAQIDLSAQVGNQVTIEFVTADCGGHGHFGYAYIDRFCGDAKGSPTGNLTYNCEASSHCGPGQICFDYELPVVKDPKGTIITGAVILTLSIYQNGVQLAQISSPKLTSGTSFCFPITPASITGINLGAGGFDFVATGAFSIGNTSLGHIKVGTAPEGITPGKNNDYQIACKTCEEIKAEQEAYLGKSCAHKVNVLPRTSCDCPESGALDGGDCRCRCVAVKFPDIKPCISVKWGDSECDCMETDDVEILCVTVCNCYSNVTFNDLSIGHIKITDTAGNPVPTLPDGTPSVQIIPSGPICFGDIPPCKEGNHPGCVSREVVLYTRGAIGKDYRVSFEGVCFNVTHEFQSKQCFILKLCQD